MNESDKPDVAAMRRQYTLAALHEEDMLADPVAQFTAWFKQAPDAEVLEPNAVNGVVAMLDDGRSAIARFVRDGRIRLEQSNH